ncbi:unnamed protein product [Lota lota]
MHHYGSKPEPLNNPAPEPMKEGRSGHKGSQRTVILQMKWHQAPDSGASEPSGGPSLKD